MSRSAQNLEAALAACLDDLQAGMTPAQCLARYPEYADQLEPLLLTAERLQGQPWPTLSAGGRVRGRERMHAALASRRPAGFAWWSVLRPILAAVVLLALAGGVWLAWPGRQSTTTDLPTSAPVVLQATPSPALTLRATATLTLTVTATPTGTVDDANPVPTETNVPEVIEGADGTETPFATATLRTRNTPTSGDRLSTPVPTQTASPAATAGPSRPQQTPDRTMRHLERLPRKPRRARRRARHPPSPRRVSRKGHRSRPGQQWQPRRRAPRQHASRHPPPSRPSRRGRRPRPRRRRRLSHRRHPNQSERPRPLKRPITIEKCVIDEPTRCCLASTPTGADPTSEKSKPARRSKITIHTEP